MQKLTKTITCLILSSSCFLWANSALGRVGESESQIDHRYGKPTGKWDDYVGYKKLYHWHGFDVMVTFVDGVSQREMFNRTAGALDQHDQKYLSKISGANRNGIIFDKDSFVYTTKEFEEKYVAARNAAWTKSDQKQ